MAQINVKQTTDSDVEWNAEEAEDARFRTYFSHYFDTPVEQLREELQEAYRESDSVKWRTLEEVDARLRLKYFSKENTGETI